MVIYKVLSNMLTQTRDLTIIIIGDLIITILENLIVS